MYYRAAGSENTIRLTFSDFRKNEINLNLFAHPFNVSVEDAPEEVQIELIELQCNAKRQIQFRVDRVLLKVHPYFRFS